MSAQKSTLSYDSRIEGNTVHSVTGKCSRGTETANRKVLPSTNGANVSGIYTRWDVIAVSKDKSCLVLLLEISMNTGLHSRERSLFLHSMPRIPQSLSLPRGAVEGLARVSGNPSSRAG